MVTVVNYKQHEKADGDKFFTLELRGELEMVKSQKTGKFYATTKKCSIVSTFDEHVCKMMIGKSLPGSIVKKEVESYDYAIPESGEVIQLTHRWEYQHEEVKEPSVEQVVFQD